MIFLYPKRQNLPSESQSAFNEEVRWSLLNGECPVAIRFRRPCYLLDVVLPTNETFDNETSCNHRSKNVSVNGECQQKKWLCQTEQTTSLCNWYKAITRNMLYSCSLFLDHLPISKKGKILQKFLNQYSYCLENLHKSILSNPKFRGDGDRDTQENNLEKKLFPTMDNRQLFLYIKSSDAPNTD